MEKEIDKFKEKSDERTIRGLISLYSEAIEYFAYLEQMDRVADMQQRMQSILVRPYVLDALARIED